MKDVLVGRVDLVRALCAGGEELQEAAADLLGFERKAEMPRPPKVDTVPGQPPEPRPEPESVPAGIDAPFWQARDFEAREPRRGDDAIPIEPAPANVRPMSLPSASLASGAAILTRLRGYSAFSDLSGGIDLDRTVARLSRGQFLHAFPRRPRKRWGQLIQVIADRSRRLAPFWLDQDLVISHLRQVYPRSGFQLAILEDGATDPRIQLPPEHAGRYTVPDPGTIVLVLGDLGCLARQEEQRDQLVRMWLEWGRRFQANANAALALVPCHPNRCRGELSRRWTILPWEAANVNEAPLLSAAEAEEVSDQVLTRLAFALRVEPRLLRAVRRMLPEGRGDAGIESHVWQHEAFLSRHHEAATFDPRGMRSLLPRFFCLPEPEQRRVVELVRALRRDVYPGVWFSELLALERDVAAGVLDLAELRQAAWWCLQRMRILRASGAASDPAANEPTWFRQVFARLPKTVNQGIAARTLHAIWAVVSPGEEAKGRPDFLDSALLPETSQTERLIALRHVADRLVARSFPGLQRGGSHGVETEDRQHPGSLIGLIRSRNGLIKIERLDEFWEGGAPPAWAHQWGWDQYGAWATLRVGDATQRLRWIPPGKFWMGSPEDKEGRYPDEEPRHEETIASGFWMFDTPCTQTLWQAVMGENPSRFKGPDRPVESVSWDQCQEFLKRLNARCTGLELKLPSETQWEYACRAGTKTPRYREDLNEIAWYRENSQGETHSVGQLVPNDWGLYDTLGNVWEWCEDVWTEDYNKKKEARASRAASAHRVFRGGSWSTVARHVRAAYRVHFEPSNRSLNLGFRCAEFRTPGPVGRKEQQGAERAGERGGVGAEHPGDRDTASGAGWINVDAPGMDAVSFATLTPVRVSSDVEQVVLRTTTLPRWASAIGRDKYGLWAEFTIEGKVAKPPTKRAAKKKSAPPKVPLGPVRQRLRWIPPGRFLMGSPPDEEGRYSREGPQHEVTIAEGFWMSDTPCTQALWEALMGENPSHFKVADRPVESVSWEQCQEFLTALNSRLDGIQLSLPSEAQWEYACRAGTETARYSENLDAIAWYDENSGKETHSVAGKEANSWGLYDMLGNVREWCKDVWVEDYTEKSRAAASAESASAHRVIRGGSWGHVARSLRAASRSDYEPSYRLHYLGFRCAEFRQGVVSGARQGSEAEGAEQPGDRDPTSAAARLGEDGGLSAQSN